MALTATAPAHTHPGYGHARWDDDEIVPTLRKRASAPARPRPRPPANPHAPALAGLENESRMLSQRLSGGASPASDEDAYYDDAPAASRSA
jgi:hypothetical protein